MQMLQFKKILNYYIHLGYLLTIHGLQLILKKDLNKNPIKNLKNYN